MTENVVFEILDETINSITIKDLEKSYEIIINHYEKYLKKEGVRKPPGFNTLGGVIFSLLAYDYPNQKIWTKSQILKAIALFGHRSNDPQYMRHLGNQSGYCILQHRFINDKFDLKVKAGTYYLDSLEFTHPHYVKDRRRSEPDKLNEDAFCRSCWGKKGEGNRKYTGIIKYVSYQHAHPDRPKVKGDRVALCDICNKIEQDHWQWRLEVSPYPKPFERCRIKKVVDFYKVN